MNKLSEEEQSQIGALKNGATTELTRGDRSYTFRREDDLIAEFSPEASGQMQFMPLLDMLMGTAMREERDFEVQLEKTQAVRPTG